MLSCHNSLRSAEFFFLVVYIFRSLRFTIWVGMYEAAMLLAINPSSNVDNPVCKLEHSSSVYFVVSEFTFVDISVCKPKNSSSVSYTVLELTFVDISVCKLEDSSSVYCVVSEFTFVDIFA